MTQTATAPRTNGLSLNDLLGIATDLGKQAGLGKDTQIKMLLQLVEGGYHGGIDTNKDKHGPGVPDAQKLAEAYVKAQTGATVFDAKAPNQRKTISCFNTCIKLGQWPKGGTGEPLGTVNKLMTERAKLRKNPATAKKLDDAANTLLKYARVQLKRDQLLSDDELSAMCFRKEPELRNAEEIIASHRDALQKLYQGKAASGTALDDSAEVKQAIDTLTQRLKDIATAKRSGPMAQMGALTTS